MGTKKEQTRKASESKKLYLWDLQYLKRMWNETGNSMYGELIVDRKAEYKKKK